MKRKFFWILIAFLSHGNLFAQRDSVSSDVLARNAMSNYMNNGDTSFRYEVKDSLTQAGLKLFLLVMESQLWHGIRWRHQLYIVVPTGLNVKSKKSLLFIAGGHNSDHFTINADDEVLRQLKTIALINKCCVALVKQVPNEPLFGGMVEDQIISYTLHRFQADHDYSWPLLFPMVKSVKRGMDAVQHFIKKETNVAIDSFLLSGASKRGWTTWLTAASDSRVGAIAPMVIDVLNMPRSLQYQIDTWKKYSVEIQDYERLGIVQQSQSRDGRLLLSMVDPYSYRDHIKIPKLLLMGTNDAYWVGDNVKNYYDSLQGSKLLHYSPNVGHDLGDKEDAFSSLNGFFKNWIIGRRQPEMKWEVFDDHKKVNILLKPDFDHLQQINLWTATSSDPDFRNNVWLKTKKMAVKDHVAVLDSMNMPATGFLSFYYELVYKYGNERSYAVTSRVFTIDTVGLVGNPAGHLLETVRALKNRNTSNNPMLVAAHRGEHNDVPENSLLGFSRTINQGTDVLELDVRVSKDGVPFVLHDATLDRTSTGKGKAEDMTMAEIKQYFLKNASNGTVSSETVPTLKEALLQCKDKILVDLDIKTDKLEPVVRLIKELDMVDNVLFFDEDMKTIDYVRQTLPDAMLMPRVRSEKAALDVIAKYHPLIVHIDNSFLSADLVYKIHQGNANVWINALGEIDEELMASPINSSKKLQDYLMKKCNVLQTNLPQRLKEAMKL